MPFFTERRVACGTSSAAPPGSRSPTRSASAAAWRPRSTSRASPRWSRSRSASGSAIYLSEYAPERVRRTVKPILELLAGMPTIVLGFFALDSVIPALQDLGIVAEGPALQRPRRPGIVVGILITPLISSLSEDAMRAVPSAMREGAYGVGRHQAPASRRGSCFPAALSGIMAGDRPRPLAGRRRDDGRHARGRDPAQPDLGPDAAHADDHRLHRPDLAGRGDPRQHPVRVDLRGRASCCSWSRSIINLVAVRFVRRFRTVYQ